MNPKRTPPKPIIDNLEFIGNPYKQRGFNASLFTAKSVANADTDLEYVLKFLYSYNGSTATFNSYRRELERLLQWAWRINETSLLTIKREHIEEYISFSLNPPKSWTGTKNVARFKSREGARVANPDWRRYVVTVSKLEARKGTTPDTKDFCPSQSAIKATFTALSSFFDYLNQENLIDSNPVLLIKQKSKFIRKDQSKPIVRRISNTQWDYVVEVVERMADANPAQHERSLFVMNCLFAMYLRVSELVADERSNPTMGDFQKDKDKNWWLHVTGKGNKSRTVTVCDEMIGALKRYRKFRGLSTYPVLGEQEPLVPKLKGSGPVSSTRLIRTIVQECFDAAYEQMKLDGLEDEAAELQSATVHWLRHTGISEDVKYRPREHVRDDAGHATMATTDRYIDSDLRERHASGREKRIKEL